MSGCPLAVSGLEHLRDVGPAVFVANHASYLDVVVVFATLPSNLRFAVKGRLAAYPVLGTIIRRAGYIAIDKTTPAQQLEGAARISDALDAGESLFVFPEGTFVRSPGLLPFRLGAFHAAAELDLPVIPVALTGTRRILPAGTLLLRPGRIGLAIQPPLRPRDAGWNEVVRLRDETRRCLSRAVGEVAG